MILHEDIGMIAAMIDEHPDVYSIDDKLLLEWFWGRDLSSYFTNPTEKYLSKLIKPDDVKKIKNHFGSTYEQALEVVMKDLVQELKSFQKKMSSLSAYEAIEAFAYYKEHKDLPPALRARGREAEKHMYGGEWSRASN